MRLPAPTGRWDSTNPPCLELSCKQLVRATKLAQRIRLSKPASSSLPLIEGMKPAYSTRLDPELGMTETDSSSSLLNLKNYVEDRSDFCPSGIASQVWVLTFTKQARKRRQPVQKVIFLYSKAFHEASPAQYTGFFHQPSGASSLAHQGRPALSKQLAENSPSEPLLRPPGRARLLTKRWGPR